MRNDAVVYVFVVLLALVQASLVSAWPLPSSLICFPLIVVSALALNLKPKTAAVTAVLSGLVLDMLSPTFFGLHAIAILLSVSITSVLLFSVLTHHTVTAVAGVNAAVFLMYHLLLFVFNSVFRFFASGPLFHPATGQALLLILMALLIQVAAAVVIMLVMKGLSGYTNRFILVK